MAQIAKGLEGVVVADTALSHIDGERGRLIYCGYDIGDLAAHATFEEVAYLLWHGHLPNRAELAEFTGEMARYRTLPPAVVEVIRVLPDSAEPLEVLRTAVSAFAAALDFKGHPSVTHAMALTGSMPSIMATFDRLRRGLPPVPPRADLSHASNYLYMLTGEVPSEQRARALETYLVLTADHGLNASTFTARVIASTLSDMGSAIVGAIGALKGPLHGGAPALVLDMLRAIGKPENAEAWLKAVLDRGERIMGFGHRVYRTEDPRARVLRALAERTSEIEFFKLALHVEDVALRLLHERKPERRIYTNVEFYSAAVLHGVGLPDDLFTPTFAISRVAGWTAHVIEQLKDNRLIRPDAEYVGPMNLTFVPLDQR
ncbi:MAG: citrate synthase [Chloroflexi bacterium]|nr:citrate synthase [Chloroflexota bacterium]HLG51214.1 citrate synthase [Chloroflexota bacterium]